MKTPHSLRLLAAGLCGLMALAHAPGAAQSIQPTGPQQLVFAGLRTVANQGQFNAVQSDAFGNLYLLLDQKDGVRLLKTDPNATSILAQTQLGAKGDIGLAMALDPSGNVYITGTTTSGALISTSGAAFPNAADTSTNSFIGKFDANLNPIFVTFAGSGRMAATSIAATSDAVFITGSIFAATLPVTPAAIIQSTAFGSTQNGFVEKFNTTGTTLLYATYLSGQSGNTAPAAIAADSSGNTYITGYTTSSGYPTFAALIPNILSPTSGFLTKLTPAADGILFSTFIPGPGITSIAIDPTTQTLLLSGSVALGQFPITTVTTPLVDTTYQTLLRIPLDGATVLSSTLLAPGTQSTLTPSPTGATWVTTTLTTPASLLPLTPLSTIGNSYALRITPQNIIDQAIRFGGLPTSNSLHASAPATLTSLITDPTGQPIFAGSVTPTASANLLPTETYDLPLYNSPTAALPSTIHNAALPPGTCNGSLCPGSAAYLTKLNPTPAPSLALSTDDSPNITLRNLGTLPATNLQLSATNFTLTTNCPTTLPPGNECSIALTGTGPGTITAQASNATPQTATLPATTNPINPIAVSPKELDFGIQTTTSPAATRTVSITNLSQSTQTFASTGTTPFTEQSSDCTLATPGNKLLAPGSTCHITLALTPTTDGPVTTYWTLGQQQLLLTAYTQTTSLNISATEVDFGTQYPGSPHLPRDLYLSNNSAAAISHTPVTLPTSSPFTITDRCPTTLDPHTVCQLLITYASPQTPSSDSTTITLDQGITLLITGSTLPPPTGTGQSANPNLTVTPTTLNFPNTVVVTRTSATTQTVTLSNTGTQPFPLTLATTGDFTQTTNCPANLPGTATCNALITFAPSQPGTRQGLLTISTGASTTPTYVTLSGTGNPILPTSNGTLDFGSVIIGQPTVQWYKITQPFSTLTAATTLPDYKAILVEDIGFGHGAPPTSAFATTAIGPCTNCWLGVQFQPSAAGPDTAALTLASTPAGNPEPLTLTGSGLALTGLILTPATQDFGPIPVNSISAPTLFTLTNLTPNPVTLTAPTATGDFTISTAPTGGAPCTTTLAPDASCFIQIIFTPTAPGPRTGTLTIQTLTTPLTGFGAPDPGLSLNPTALTFTNIPGTTSTQQTITLTNTGTASLAIANPTTTTPNFTPTTNCTTLAPTSTCTITITFTPSTSYLADTLQIPVTSSTTGLTTYTVPLSSTYTTEDTGLQIIPGEANFGPNLTTTLGLTRQFTLNNLTAKSLAVDIALPRQFVLAGPPCSGLAPNASCNFSVTFLPLTNGDITGTLFAQATPTDGSATLNGLGYVEGYGTDAGTLVITGNLLPGDLLNFGQVSSGQTATQTLTLTNKGTAPLTIRRITSEWPFLASTTCGATLAANQSCTATLTYTPLNQVATGTTSALPNNDSGTLVIESDALSSPDLIDLTGSAAPISVNAPSNTAPLNAYVASQNSLTFAATSIGNSSTTQTVTLSNTGTTTIHITNLQITPDFTVVSGCTAIVPGTSCDLIVSFTPQISATPGNRISALEITTDASTSLDFISLLGIAAPSTLTFAPTSLDFGSVQIGSTAHLPIQITNTAPTPATFNGITTTGDYTAAGTCPTSGNTLAPATSCTLQIAFTPTATGTRTGTVAVATSISTLPLTAILTGTGTQSHLQITPASLNFGSIAIGASANQTLTLSNTGTATVSSIALAITGDYAITVPCNLTLLTPGANCTVTVTYTPTALGARPGSLTITSTDTASPATIPIAGTGTPNGTFTLTVNSSATATATVPSGRPATYNLTLTPLNNFNGTVVLNCTPINPGPYATCSLLPSSITLNGTNQNAAVTINTITSTNPTTAAQKTSSNRPGKTAEDANATSNSANRKTSSSNKAVLCLVPAALFFFWKIRKPQTSQRSTNTDRPGSPHPRSMLCIILLAATTLYITACGSGGDASLRYTPPGTYQYQITASSTNGVQQTQTVTLNLTVTAQ
jgi:trimeric autotransporter adhesin